jgi:hypothetical protein
MAATGGQPGNQNAKKAKLWESALKRSLARAEGSVDKGLDKLADICVNEALNGDKDARTEIACRIDGKPAQSLTVGGDEENPLRTVSKIELVNLE